MTAYELLFHSSIPSVPGVDSRPEMSGYDLCLANPRAPIVLLRPACIFLTPEEFITILSNKGLEKAKNQFPHDRRLNVPSEGHEGNPSYQFLDQG